MNSMTASYNPSHEGNTPVVAPKDVGGLPWLTLNDGKQVPMVHFLPPPSILLLANISPSSHTAPAPPTANSTKTLTPPTLTRTW